MAHPYTSQVTVHTNAAGRQYAFDSQTQTSKWLKRRSSGGADDWTVFVSSKGKEYIGSPSDAAKPMWVNQVFDNERKRKKVCRTPSPESDDSSSKRNKTKEAPSPMSNTKAPSVPHDAIKPPIKPGGDDAAGKAEKCDDAAEKAAKAEDPLDGTQLPDTQKGSDEPGTQKGGDSDTDEAKAAALAKVGRRVTPKWVIPPPT